MQSGKRQIQTAAEAGDRCCVLGGAAKHMVRHMGTVGAMRSSQRRDGGRGERQVLRYQWAVYEVEKLPSHHRSCFGFRPVVCCFYRSHTTSRRRPQRKAGAVLEADGKAHGSAHRHGWRHAVGPETSQRPWQEAVAVLGAGRQCKWFGTWTHWGGMRPGQKPDGDLGGGHVLCRGGAAKQMVRRMSTVGAMLPSQRREGGRDGRQVLCSRRGDDAWLGTWARWEPCGRVKGDTEAGTGSRC